MIKSIQKLTREVRLLCIVLMFVTLINIFLIGVIWNYTKVNLELENAQAKMLIEEHKFINEFMESLKPKTTEKHTSGTGKKSDISYK